MTRWARMTSLERRRHRLTLTARHRRRQVTAEVRALTNFFRTGGRLR